MSNKNEIIRELVAYELCDVCHKEIDKRYYIQDQENSGEKLKVCEECSEKGVEI